MIAERVAAVGRVRAPSRTTLATQWARAAASSLRVGGDAFGLVVERDLTVANAAASVLERAFARLGGAGVRLRGGTVARVTASFTQSRIARSFV